MERITATHLFFPTLCSKIRWVWVAEEPFYLQHFFVCDQNKVSIAIEKITYVYTSLFFDNKTLVVLFRRQTLSIYYTQIETRTNALAFNYSWYIPYFF